jgi:hypothetical protein
MGVTEQGAFKGSSPLHCRLLGIDRHVSSLDAMGCFVDDVEVVGMIGVKRLELGYSGY